MSAIVDIADAVGRERVVYQDEHVVLICARWQDVVPALPTAAAVIVDAPYSERTHKGHNAAVQETGIMTTAIHYDPWSPADVAEACAAWSSKCSGWIVSVTDHVLAPAWESELGAAGLYTFAPLPFVAVGSRVRKQGDGPSCWTCQVVAARPKAKRFLGWGALDGAYILPKGEGGPLYIGGKPPWLMRRLCVDYSRVGALVLDPCSGGGTLGRAAKDTGRLAVLIEENGNACETAARILRPHRSWQQGFDIEERGA